MWSIDDHHHRQQPSATIIGLASSTARFLRDYTIYRRPTRVTDSLPKRPAGKRRGRWKKEDASFLVFPGDITDWPSQLWLCLKGPAEPAIKLCNKSRKKGRQEAERYTWNINGHLDLPFTENKNVKGKKNIIWIIKREKKKSSACRTWSGG